MASLHQAGSYLAERAGKKTDITFIKQMKDLVVIESARLKANSLSKTPSLASHYIQRFHVPLKKVDSTDECNEEAIDKCEMVYRSVLSIPEPIRFTSNPFPYVGSPDGGHAFGWTTFGTEPKRRVKKLTGKFPRHTYANNYLYIFNIEIDEIAVEGVFSDPRSVSKFKCNGTPCYSDEQEFPIDEQTLKLVYDEIITKHLRLVIPNEKIQIKEDKNV
jgi:hypothetical protein